MRVLDTDELSGAVMVCGVRYHITSLVGSPGRHTTTEHIIRSTERLQCAA